MTRQTQADLWQNFIGDRLNDIAQTFNEEHYHELLNKQQTERIDDFLSSLNEAQQAKFTDIDDANSLIREAEELNAYRTGLVDGIWLMCSL